MVVTSEIIEQFLPTNVYGSFYLKSFHEQQIFVLLGIEKIIRKYILNNRNHVR